MKCIKDHDGGSRRGWRADGLAAPAYPPGSVRTHDGRRLELARTEVPGEQYLTGLELERVAGVLRQGEAGGFSVEGERNVHITSVEIVDGRADVRACVHTDFRTLDSAGTVVERIDRSIMSRFLLEKSGESWKVADTGDENAEGETEACSAGT